MKMFIMNITILFSVCSIFSQDVTQKNLQEILTENRWYDVFYAKVLQKNNRDNALDYLPFHKKNPQIYFGHLDAERYWYEADYWPTDALVMDEEGFNFFGHLFDIIEVKQIPTGSFYKISISVSDNLQKRNDENDDYSYHNWELTRSRSRFTFLFVFDGDFLDIFVDDFSKHFATFCRYDDATKKEIKNLINYNSYNEENVTWPCRESKNHVVNSSCMVIETLRLRKEEDTTSETMLKMERGTFVRITALGKQQTIDGITANWVKVELEDGTEGWCFGGYLVEIPEERNNSVSERAEKAQKEAIIESDDKSGNENKNESTNPEIIIAAGCVVLLLVLLTVITVIARRKRD